jgi:FixJ family two-component response regulator
MTRMGVLLQDAPTPTARKNIAICVLDDDSNHVELVTTRLEKAGFPTIGTSSPQEALENVRLGSCRVVLADLKMSDMDGLEFLEKALQNDPGVYVILITSLYSVESAIDAIRRGAHDYLNKPLDFRRLEKTLDDITEVFSRRSEIRQLEHKLFENHQFHGVVGKSPAMLDMLDLVKKVSRHYSNVLITGPRAPARSSSLMRFTSSARWRKNDSRFATARHSSILCSKANSSVMCAAHSPVPRIRGPASSNSPMAARFFSTRSAKCHSACKPSCCV